MSTLQEVNDRIADDLNRTDLFATINVAINRAISYYAKEPFWFTETSSTFTSSDSAAYYASASPAAFPTDIGRIEYVEITVNGNDYELQPWSIEQIQTANVNGTKNQPIAYSWWNNRIYTYPLANGTYPITVYYTKTYSSLTGTGSSNDFTTYAEDLIESRARWWLYNRVIMDAQQAKAAKEEEAEALQALREKNTGYASNVGVKGTCF